MYCLEFVTVTLTGLCKKLEHKGQVNYYAKTTLQYITVTMLYQTKQPGAVKNGTAKQSTQITASDC